MDFHYCPVNHLEDSFIIMCGCKSKRIEKIGKQTFVVETNEWRCPVCDCESILQSYSEEAYSDTEN